MISVITISIQRQLKVISYFYKLEPSVAERTYFNPCSLSLT